MKIAELFHGLEVPPGDKNALAALPIPGTAFSRIARDGEGHPTLLFALSPALQSMDLRGYRLKYLELLHNISCTITEQGKSVSDVFTLVRFIGDAPQLQDYFLRYAESLVQMV